MSTMLKASASAALVLGIPVTRAAALLPGTGTAAIFNVLGGKVLVTSLVGEVVTVMPATVNTLAVNGTPTTGTQVIWGSATATTSKEQGTIITLAGTVGGAVVVQNAGGGNPVTPQGLIAQIGTITLTTTATAATGTVKWTLTYVQLDAGASVTAA